MKQVLRTLSLSVRHRTAIVIFLVVMLTCLCSALEFPSAAAHYFSSSTGRDEFDLAQQFEPAGAAPTTPLIISEFRLRGPNGPNDEFVEIYNNSDAPHTVTSIDSSGGYALVGSSNSSLNDGLPSTRFVIPNGTIIPARGHFLAVNNIVPGYSLSSYPAGNGTTAVGDLTFNLQIPDNVGLALFQTALIGNFTLANRIDAIGSNADNNALYREGVGYSAIPASALEGSFFRKLPGGCTGSASGNCNSVPLVNTTPGPSISFLQDTGNNLNDILYADTAGTNVGASRRLGAPGPQNVSSPLTGVSSGLVISRLDSTVSEDAAPNRVRNTTPGDPFTSSFGTLTFRRRLTNNVGQPITRLRFRIVDITTFPSIGTGCNVEPAPAGCVADLRALTNTGSVITVNDPATCAPATAPCLAVVQDTTLETPPNQPAGGAYNSSWSVGSVTVGSPLAIGASINLQFLTGLEQTGADRLFVLVEALPRSGPPSTAVIRLAGPASPTPTPTPTPGPTTSTFQFEQPVYTIGEDITFATVTVLRSGNTAGAATVDFATSDITATQKADYTIALGTLSFATGELSKTLDILISEDSKVEGQETLIVSLSNPTGSAGIGAIGTATIQITDDVVEPATNVNDDPTIFVGQHYHDFLNRQHDASGLAFWVDQITSCGGDPECIAIRRINVSAAFFLSIEFQETGFFVIRNQRVAFGRKSDTAASRFLYQEFVRDARQVGKDVIIGQAGADAQLEANKQAYATQIVTSTAFITRFPIGLSAEQYVDALFSSAMVTPTTTERDAAITAFGGGGTSGRVAALRSVSSSASLTNAEFNPAFVLLQYYGYLRRNPTDAPDGNDNGYQFWLTKLNMFGGNFVNAEMVKAFILSGEYRDRFGP